jgi:glycosyltransferase involved in cell wall biosynthesis
MAVRASYMVTPVPPAISLAQIASMVRSICTAKARGSPVRILLIHNSYQKRGGEEVLFETERRVLLARGHEVLEYCRTNDEIRRATTVEKLTLPLRTVWAWDSYSDVRKICVEKRPSVALAFNTMPLVSPAVVYACRSAKTPLIQHIQNYRLMCAAGTLFRDGGVCEECLDHGAWRGVLHACYRDSRLASATVTAHTTLHKIAKTWSRKVNAFIAPSAFIRDFAVRGGIPHDKIYLKPNCVEPDPGRRGEWERFALFAGRLSAEKGIWTLIRAWAQLDPCIPLRIAGDGPLRGELEVFASDKGLKNVAFLGALPHEEVLALMKRARLVVFPTECYEGFPMTVVEALACGAAIVASDLGAVREVLREGDTGYFFDAGNITSLANRIISLWNSAELNRVSAHARAEYEAKYTGERNHDQFIEIVRRVTVLENRTEKTSPTTQ